MGTGSSRGDDRAVAAAEMAISSPLLEASIDGAHGVLLSIQGGSDLGLFEINEAAQLVSNSAAVDANIIFGAVIDDALGDEVRVTVIAAGLDENRAGRGAGSAGSAESGGSAFSSTSSFFYLFGVFASEIQPGLGSPASIPNSASISRFRGRPRSPGPPDPRARLDPVGQAPRRQRRPARPPAAPRPPRAAPARRRSPASSPVPEATAGSPGRRDRGRRAGWAARPARRPWRPPRLATAPAQTRRRAGSGRAGAFGMPRHDPGGRRSPYPRALYSSTSRPAPPSWRQDIRCRQHPAPARRLRGRRRPGCPRLPQVTDPPAGRTRRPAHRGAAAHLCLRRGGRDASVTLIAVTKTFPASDVRLLSGLGVCDIGENRDAEAAPKAAQCADLTSSGISSASCRPTRPPAWRAMPPSCTPSTGYGWSARSGGPPAGPGG